MDMAVAPTAISVRRSRHCSHRLFEWMTALMMGGMSFTILASPTTVASGGFHLLQNLGLSPNVLIFAFALASALRMAGLYANGHWRVYGPWCRALGALGGAFIWGQMAISLLIWSEQTGYVSLGVPVYLSLALGEFVSCYRAARDARVW